jgi:hypothetical protein
MPFAISHPLRALRSRDFRIYFGGQLIFMAGTWMQQVAMGWLAYKLSGSALVLGLLGFAVVLSEQRGRKDAAHCPQATRAGRRYKVVFGMTHPQALRDAVCA